jgi:hypothetical protein
MIQADTVGSLETLPVLCLCGPAAEECFCGPIKDGSDATDEQMARQYLADQFDPCPSMSRLSGVATQQGVWFVRSGRRRGSSRSPMHCSATAR